MRRSLLALAAVTLVFAGCQPRISVPESATPEKTAPTAAQRAGTPPNTRIGTNPGHAGTGTPLVPAPGLELAAFAEGCFWGSENTFRHVPGVIATAVGYTGGHTKNPTYQSVSSHATGHAEAVLVEFDPRQINYEALLRTFWESHDPTTKNRQGPDVGDQYRSAIFTFSEVQARVARVSLTEQQKHLKRPIATEVQPIGAFYRAEEHHQQYDEKTGTESCPLPARDSRI